MDDRVVLIAGGSGGIGKGLVRGLCEPGVKVCFTYNSAKAAADALVEELGQENAFPYKCDVLNRDEIRKVVMEIEERFGKIDVLVNVFGITNDKSLVFMQDDEWNSVIEINLNGLYYFTRAVITGMVKQRCGSIINFSSVSGLTGMSGQANYSASKAAMIGFSKSLAKEVSSRGVRVNVIAPGFIESPMVDKLPEDYLVKMKKNIPVGRIGKVEDLVGITRLLACDDSSYITGQVFVVDGGMTMCG